MNLFVSVLLRSINSFNTYINTIVKRRNILGVMPSINLYLSYIDLALVSLIVSFLI
nr:MAG TPA: hypothetical protein [Caudoviricetes sp.]